MRGTSQEVAVRAALADWLEREEEIATDIRKVFRHVENMKLKPEEGGPPKVAAMRRGLGKRSMQLRLLGEALGEAQRERMRLEQQLAAFEQPRPEPRVGFWEFSQWLLGSVGSWLVRPRTPAVASAGSAAGRKRKR